MKPKNMYEYNILKKIDIKTFNIDWEKKAIVWEEGGEYTKVYEVVQFARKTEKEYQKELRGLIKAINYFRDKHTFFDMKELKWLDVSVDGVIDEIISFYQNGFFIISKYSDSNTWIARKYLNNLQVIMKIKNNSLEYSKKICQDSII